MDGVATTLLARALKLFRVVNYGCGVFFLVAITASIAAAGFFAARLAAKYGAAIDVAGTLMAMRVVLLFGLFAVYAVDRLFAALIAMVETVRAGDPFVAGNAGRLDRIGWALLALQLLDLLGGVASWWFKAHGVDYIDWTPSLTGWLAVLVAFVLARVFSQGAAMRDDLDGTI